jgi:hypothetical protein
MFYVFFLKVVAVNPIASSFSPCNARKISTSSDEQSSPPPSPVPPLLDDHLQLPLTPPRPRGPKHPVPEELKDERYFKRRRRNNEAAKRSRRARKERQDADLKRIATVELENATLRMQLLQLRAEYDTLAHLLVRRQALYLQENTRLSEK